MQYNRRRFLKSAGAGLAASVLVNNNIIGGKAKLNHIEMLSYYRLLMNLTGSF